MCHEQRHENLSEGVNQLNGSEIKDGFNAFLFGGWAWRFCRTEEFHIGWTQSVKHIFYINDVQFNNLPARFDRVPMYLSGLGAFFFMKPVEPSSPAHLLKREHKQNWISPTTNPQELSGGIWGLTCFSSSFMKGASRPLRLWDGNWRPSQLMSHALSSWGWPMTLVKCSNYLFFVVVVDCLPLAMFEIC